MDNPHPSHESKGVLSSFVMVAHRLMMNRFSFLHSNSLITVPPDGNSFLIPAQLLRYDQYSGKYFCVLGILPYHSRLTPKFGESQLDGSQGLMSSCDAE